MTTTTIHKETRASAPRQHCCSHMMSSSSKPRRFSLTLFFLIIALSSTLSSSSSSSSALVLASPPVLPAMAAVQSASNPNVVIQLASYVKNSVVKTVDGCGQLWKNHGRCNDIRKKIGAYRDAVKLEWEAAAAEQESSSFEGEQQQQQPLLSSAQKDRLKTMTGGISYEEFVFLQKGKEDRSKVFNLFFLMWGAPRFLPYALMFNPDMLPSPFRDTSTTTATTKRGESIWAKQSRERSTAVIQALLNLERDARVTSAFAKFNVFGKKKQDADQQLLVNAIGSISNGLSSPLPPHLGAAQLLTQFQSLLYRAEKDFTRAEKRLCQVPKSLVQGVNGILSGGGGGLLAGLQPHFMTRGRVVGHLRKVAESDDFLLNNNMDLALIPKRFLQEACSERLMGVLGLTTIELRQQLQDWLTIITPTEEGYYNDNLARFALMGYYSCWAARDVQSALKLPRLLYAPIASIVSSGGSSDGNDGSSGSFNSPLRRFIMR